jgi:hypothetical protein
MAHTVIYPVIPVLTLRLKLVLTYLQQNNTGKL